MSGAELGEEGPSSQARPPVRVEGAAPRARAFRPATSGHSTHTSAVPILARWKSGAGHEALHVDPLHVGSLARGNVYAQPPGPHVHAIPVAGSLPFTAGAASTHAPDRFT